MVRRSKLLSKFTRLMSSRKHYYQHQHQHAGLRSRDVYDGESEIFSRDDLHLYESGDDFDEDIWSRDDLYRSKAGSLDRRYFEQWSDGVLEQRAGPAVPAPGPSSPRPPTEEFLERDGLVTSTETVRVYAGLPYGAVLFIFGPNGLRTVGYLRDFEPDNGGARTVRQHAKYIIEGARHANNNGEMGVEVYSTKQEYVDAVIEELKNVWLSVNPVGKL